MLIGLKRMWPFVGLIFGLPPACHALCVAPGAGDLYRHASVADEFKRSPLVITGRVQAARDLSSPDDPQGYAWTVYTVEVLQIFKGMPAPTIRVLSENTSARFSMNLGTTYLLFVSHSPQPSMAGQERLPQDYVDSCGNSASIVAAGQALQEVRRMAGTK